MKKFFCLTFVLWGSLSLRALDREAFTFTKYDLDVRVEPEQQRLGARGKITLRNDSSSPQRTVTLQISSSLSWSAVTLNGKPVEYETQPYVSDIDHTGALSEAIVVLPQAVAPKQSVELEVGYEGVIPLDVTRLTRIGVPEDTAKHTDWDQIGRTFAAVRGIGYVAWYPIVTEAVSLAESSAVPDTVARWMQREETAEMRVVFYYSGSADQPRTLQCNAPTTPKTSANSGRGFMNQVECKFRKLSTRSPVFVIASLQHLDRPELDIFYLPEHKSGAEDYSSAVEEVVPLVTKWFGDHRDKAETKDQTVDLPDPEAASYQSGNMLLMPLAGSDSKLLLSAVRQLAHIFFPSPREWIREGLSDYAQARLIEEKEGKKAAISYLQAHMGALLETKSQAENTAARDSLVDSKDKLRTQTTATYVWWMLRDMIGEGAFHNALQTYNANSDTNSAYMQKVLEAQSHRDLQWFFDDWVYHDRGLPDFRITSVYSSELPSGGYMVTVTVENLGDAGAEVPVTLHMQDRERSERVIVRGKSKASIRIQVPSMPESVTVNDGSVPESDMSNNEYRIQSLNR